MDPLRLGSTRINVHVKVCAKKMKLIYKFVTILGLIGAKTSSPVRARVDFYLLLNAMCLTGPVHEFRPLPRSLLHTNVPASLFLLNSRINLILEGHSLCTFQHPVPGCVLEDETSLDDILSSLYS